MNYLRVIFVFLWSLVAVPAWAEASVRVESPNFVLSGEISATDAVDIISELERFRAALFELHEISPETRDEVVDIYVIADPEIFKILRVQENFVAIYSRPIAGPRVLVNGNIFKERPGELRRSLRHEYVHHFNFRYAKTLMPRWLNEGLAEYYAAYEELPNGDYKIGAATDEQRFVATYPVASWFRFVRLLQSFGRIQNGDRKMAFKDWKGPQPPETLLFYNQSWAVVHYMQNQPGGMQKLDALNERVLGIMGGNYKETDQPSMDIYEGGISALDGDAERAIIEFLGKTALEFQTAVQDYIAREDLPSKTYTPKSPRLAPTLTITDMTELEAQAVQFRLMSMIADGSTINAKMKELKSQIEGKPELQRSILISESAQDFLMGANALALEKIDKVLTEDPVNKTAQRFKIQMQFQELLNQYYLHGDKMRTALRGALAADPDNSDFLVMMVMTGKREVGALPTEVTNALSKIESQQVIRRHPLIALNLMDFYAAQEDYDKAVNTARRGAPFVARQKYRLIRSIESLERAQKAASSTPPE